MARSDVRVIVTSEQLEYAYGEPVALNYRLENRSRAARLVVIEPFLVESRGTGELHILLGEAPIPAGLQYFDYEPPTLKKLASGAARKGRLTVALPLLETGPDGDVEVGFFGDVQIHLRVGFLKAPFHPHSANPWREFLVEQEISARARTRVRIAAP